MYVHIVGMADIYIQAQIVLLLFQIATGVLRHIKCRHMRDRNLQATKKAVTPKDDGKGCVYNPEGLLPVTCLHGVG
jgi:hypothetical protein